MQSVIEIKLCAVHRWFLPAIVNNCDICRFAIVQWRAGAEDKSTRAVRTAAGRKLFGTGGNMTVATVTEISTASQESFKDAINKGLDQANNTLTDIEGAWVKEMKVVVKGGRVQEYRVNMKLTFVVQ